MRKEHLVTAARVIFGLIFFVFGLNGFLQFLPAPPMTDKAGAFGGALAATGYMFPLIKGVEVIGGALLLSNRFVPLALTLLAPIVVNIVAFHTFLAPPNPITFLVLGLEVALAWVYRDSFRGVLQARATHSVSSDAETVKARPATV
jgi:hypothetical protein